jgi:hypothetical protein
VYKVADIKTKVRGTVKTLDKTVNTSARIKSNVVFTKDKIENSYTPEGENEIEYASNKISNSANISANKGIYTFNKYGKKAVKESAENIDKGVERVKAFKNKIAKKKEKETLEKSAKEISSSIKSKTINVTKKSTGKFVKTANSTSLKSIKTSQNIAIQTEKTAKATAKVAQKTAQRIKAAAEASVKVTKATVKAIIHTIKMMLNATKALITFLIAGGWIVTMIIVVICMIGFLVSSIFGIFFTNEYDENSKSMTQVISELNTEFMNKITTIQQENPYDEYDITGSRAEWKDVLAVYVAKYSNGDYQTEMMSLDDSKIEELKKIFWEMNEVSFTKDVTTEEQTIIHLTWTEHKTVTHTTLHITINNKTTEDMANQYNFNSSQREQLAELLKDDYISMWSNVIYGSTGSNDIVEVAKSQIGNVGGQPYWSWYGFTSRVEWCATFVSWCANECGYIDSGIIPKFASCESEGVAWFKACGLWQEAGYTPKAGDIIFFDWADSNDGQADHVGIVEKVENGRVYTIEGNSNDSCKQRDYDLNSNEIRGYGTPMY